MLNVTHNYQYLVIFNPRYERLMALHKPNPVPPEERMDIALVAAPVFAISFFWFGWTSYPSISFWAPMMSGIALGLSVVFIFVRQECGLLFCALSNAYRIAGYVQLHDRRVPLRRCLCSRVKYSPA